MTAQHAALAPRDREQRDAHKRETLGLCLKASNAISAINARSVTSATPLGRARMGTIRGQTRRAAPTVGHPSNPRDGSGPPPPPRAGGGVVYPVVCSLSEIQRFTTRTKPTNARS